jgi:hypothetical protein
MSAQAQEEACRIARIKLARHKAPDLAQIRGACEKARRFVEEDFGAGSVDVELLVDHFTKIVNIFTQPAQILVDPKGHIDWLPGRRASIGWRFWNRYQTFLEEIEKLPQEAVTSIDSRTETILELLEDPTRQGVWERTGLVVGSVQSGKTGNFLGLACKALDAGYKLVIILAGIHDSLRTQTQIRMEEAVLGYNTESNLLFDSANERVGVGTIEFEEDLVINSMTSRGDKGDFAADRLNTAFRIGSDPFIIVVKKNASILKNLHRWLVGRNGVDRNGRKVIPAVPMLMIDDESDHSSINVGKLPAGVRPEDVDPSTINRRIRTLLMAFERRAYVGYTATPFANIYVDPDVEHQDYGSDIFPRSFILTLEAPPNYVGVERVFGRDSDPDQGIEGAEGLPIREVVTDFGALFPPGHKSTFRPERLPDTLIEAIKIFMLSCTARAARGQVNVHNSMLVHVTRYVDVQRHVTEMVQEALRFVQRRIQQETGAGAKSIRAELRALWESKCVPVTRAIADERCPEMAWDQIEPFLLEASSRISAIALNGKSDDVLDYSRHRATGISVIAVGGDKLSRGLTLEGLTVSYYMRVSRMYDSLMQMGRWFGYRNGFIDLCRIYTTQQLVDWYRHVGLADAELRSELGRMMALRATPKEYGLRVRTHPQGMLVTALNKSRFSEKLLVSYAGTLAQAVVVTAEKDALKRNDEAVLKLVKDLPGKVSKDGDRAVIWEEVEPAKITEFVRSLALPATPAGFAPQRLADYIERQARQRELRSWSVLFVGGGSGGRITSPDLDYTAVAGAMLSNRSASPGSEVGSRDYVLKNSNVLSPSDEFRDLRDKKLTREWIDELFKKRVFKDGDAAEWAILDQAEGRLAVEVALQLSQHRYDVARAAGRTRPNQKRPEDRPFGSAVRDIRRVDNALLIIYPLNGHALDKRLPEGRAVFTCAVSFPSSSTATPVEYQVNEVYRQLQLDQLDAGFTDD